MRDSPFRWSKIGGVIHVSVPQVRKRGACI